MRVLFRRLKLGLQMNSAVLKSLCWQIGFSVVIALIVLLTMDLHAAFASLAASASVVAGMFRAAQRAFVAGPGDTPGAILGAFGRSVVLKWLITLGLFLVCVTFFAKTQPLALAIGFVGTVLSFIPAVILSRG